MHTTTVIRDFQSADADGISALFAEVYGAHYIYLEVYLPSLIRERNASGAWYSAVAELEGEIVAHAALRFPPGIPRHAEIALTAVSPRVSGRSIGVRLCRYLRDRVAPQFGIGMLTAILVSSHVQSQRMAAPLGFSTTGLLLDYLPSSFSSHGRESYVLSCLPLTPYPLPDIDWPEDCRNWIEPILANYGVTVGGSHQNRIGLTSAPPVDIKDDGGLITCTLSHIRDKELDEICRLPPRRLKMVRLPLDSNLMTACERLRGADYHHTGIMPAGDGHWYWLMQSGYQGASMQLHCQLARRIWEGAASNHTRVFQ